MRKIISSVITSEVLYTEEELAFIKAIDRYKTINSRMCPTWQEVLAIFHSLGYRKTENTTELPIFKRGNKCQEP